MERQRYLPSPNPEFNIWFQTFATKITTYKTKYGITDEEEKDAKESAADFNYRLNATSMVEAWGKQWTAYRNALRYGVPEGATVQAPVAPVLTPVSPVANPGAAERISNLVKKIKNHPQYSFADGQDMGIEGAEIIINPNELQPHLTAFTGTGGRPGLRWKKEHTDGIVVYKDEGNGYRKYDMDIHPDYEDKAPMPAQPAVWKYKIIYLYHGEEAGQWSNEITFNVGG